MRNVKEKNVSGIKLIAVKETCNKFGYSEARIWQLLREEKLQRFKHGRSTFIDLAEITAHYNSLSPANHAKIGRSKFSVNVAGLLQGSNGLVKPVVELTIQ